LTPVQRETLRKFFKCKEPIPQAEWAELTAKQKRSVMKESSIPRWAVSVVADRPDRMSDILAKKLTVDNYRQLATKPDNVRINAGSGRQGGSNRQRSPTRKTRGGRSPRAPSIRRGRKESQSGWSTTEFESIGRLVAGVLGRR
jgi:hypothetical protein